MNRNHFCVLRICDIRIKIEGNWGPRQGIGSIYKGEGEIVVFGIH